MRRLDLVKHSQIPTSGDFPVPEPRAITPQELTPRLERAYDFAARQVRPTIERTPDFFPMYTVKEVGGTGASFGPTGAPASMPG